MTGLHVAAHGMDYAALLGGVIALLPAWAFIGRDVDLSILGQRVHIITSSDVDSAAKEVIKAGPAAIEQARKVPEASTGRKAITSEKLNILTKQSSGWSDLTPEDQLDFLRARYDGLNSLSDLRNTTRDPNLALVALRIDIERRIRQMAEILDIPSANHPLAQLVRDIERREVLPSHFADGLLRLVDYGNRAAHGAKVAPQVVDDVANEGADVVRTLDRMIAELTWARRDA